MNKKIKIIIEDLFKLFLVLYGVSGLMCASVLIIYCFDVPIYTKILGVSFMIITAIIVIGGWILSIDDRTKGKKKK